MKIYLIGLPGSGKSTIGSLLAKKLNYEFIDTDTYIEEKAMMFIDEIFSSYGEDYFRALEINALEELKEKDNVIISTGGGIIKNKENKKLMDGVIIYLDVDLDELDKRIKNSNIKRPLLEYKTIYDIYNERKELYEYFSDMKIKNDDKEEAIKEILKSL